MPNPYEMTALEDPAERYDALPEGAGRIQEPSGDVRSFQFETPAGFDQGQALREAAIRQTIFDIRRRNAEQAAEEEQARIDAMANAQGQQIQKTLEAAERFRAMKNFKRDIEDGVAMGMSREDATIQSAMSNSLAVGGGTGAAAIANALRPIEAPTFGTTESGQPYAVSGKERRVTFGARPPALPEEGGMSEAKARRVTALEREVAGFQKQIDAGAKGETKRLLEAEIARRQPLINKELGVASMPALGPRPMIVPPPGVSAAAGASGPINPLPKSKSDLEVDQLYDTSRGVLRWTGQHFEKVAE